MSICTLHCINLIDHVINMIDQARSIRILGYCQNKTHEGQMYTQAFFQ